MKTRLVTLCFLIAGSLFPPSTMAQDCLAPVARSPYGWSADVAAQGTMAVLANGAALQVLDLTNPASPLVTGELFLPRIPKRVALAADLSYAFYTTYRYGSLHMIDLNVPASPSEVAVLEGFTWADDLAVVGDVVYLLDADTLFIIDVSTPPSLVVLGELTLAGVSPNDLRVVGDHVFLTAGDGGLRVVDVSDPTTPIEVGNLQLGVDRHASHLDVAGGLIYATGSNSGTTPRARLFIADVSDPNLPTLSAEWGLTEGSGEIEVRDGFAYINSQGYGLQIHDLSNPLTPVWAGGVYRFCDFFGALAVVENLALPTCPLLGLSIIDTTDPTIPTELASVMVPGEAYDGVVSDGLLAIADYRGLRLVDVTDPAHPLNHGFFDIGAGVRDVAVDGDLVYAVGPGPTEFNVVDVSDPSAPVVVGSTTIEFRRAQAVELVGDLAYVATSNGGLRIIDVSTFTSPTQIGSLDVPDADDMEYIDVSGGLAVLREGFSTPESAAVIIDISDPTSPAVLSTIDGMTVPGGIALHGSYLLVGEGFDLRIFDISNPAAPVERAPYLPAGGPAWVGAVEMSGSVAYLAVDRSGIETEVEAVDMGDPLFPVSLGRAPTGDLTQGFAFSHDEVYAITRRAGIDTFALCQGPIFADGFETGDTSAWSSVKTTER